MNHTRDDDVFAEALSLPAEARAEFLAGSSQRVENRRAR